MTNLSRTSHPLFVRTFLRAACTAALLLPSASVMADTAQAPLVSSDVIFEETGGTLAIEAEHFYKQTHSEKRAWHIVSSKSQPAIDPDADPHHVAGAAGGAYVEALPDTRRSAKDKLIGGENFSNEPGKMAVLHYKAHFQTPGRYYVWARAYSTGAEDNGIHFGLDGEWPASGQRWQTVAKHGWHWDSKQRTQEVHTGEPYKLFLDVAEAGPHEILVAMREDGFELDRFVLTTNREAGRPDGIGPAERVKSGSLPKPFAQVAAVVAEEQAPSAKAGDAAATQKADRPALAQPRQPAGDGSVKVSGDLKQWHKVTLTLDGPFAHELDQKPNPFTDVAMTVVFTHESGSPRHVVPGYFAADGNAAESSAQSGTKWRAHLSPDKTGRWDYQVTLRTGDGAALDPQSAERIAPQHEKRGSFQIAASDKTGRDFRAQGRLTYVGKHYLRFAGSGEYFIKAGPDAPETLLAYADFDGTQSGRRRNGRSGEAAPTQSLHRYEPHVGDWKSGNPTWQNGKGKGLIGALNYLASKGCNTLSFLPYNAGGDGDNVWPFVSRNDKLHYDCSKLDQWQIVFDHANALGLHLHFKLQENEMDDDRRGQEAAEGGVPESLDGGKLGPERKLYCREMIARYGYELALLWNLGEENTQSSEEQRDMIRYLHETDPYDHNIVVHTFPGQQDKVYPPLLGDQSLLTGASLQNSWSAAHQRTLKWVEESAKAGRPWVVCNDEQNPASLGVPPDPGYMGHDGIARVRPNPNAKADDKKKGPGAAETSGYNLHDIRKQCLWGTLLAGGAGVEYYFGYQLPENDLVCEDFRSRDKSWDFCRIALDFFREHKIPVERMSCQDKLVGNSANDNSRYCLAAPGEVYVVYLPSGGSSQLDMTAAPNRAMTVKWFNPRAGGELRDGSVKNVMGGSKVSLGDPPAEADEDWVILIR